MLSKALGRSVRAPALRLPSASSRVAPQWPRGLANKPHRAPPKKPTDYTKPLDSSKPSAAGSQKTAAAATGASSPQTEGSTTQYSGKQDELSETASPEQNTVPQSEGGGAGQVNAEGGQSKGTEYSSVQDEVKDTASPSENTAPPSREQYDASEPEAPRGPLPDLTKGIPSTLEYEMRDKADGKPEGSGINLTEDPAFGGSGRGKGELPASAYVSSTERKRMKFANYMYAAAALLGGAGFVYLGRNWESEEEERSHVDTPSGWGVGLMWERAKARLGDQTSYYTAPAFKKLLPDPDPSLGMDRPYTLVMSLEDLLVHSEWSREHGWRMAKRPGVDYFIRYLSQYYELVIFTSVPWAMAEPIIKKLDPFHIVQWPLFREATLYEKGEYIKVRESPLFRPQHS
jgi:import inner membrane translocase subunit TIM50